MTKKNNFGFPIHYGDTPSDEGGRLSDKIIAVVQTKEFQDICSTALSIVLILGGKARVSNAIPAEAGEPVAAAAEAAIHADKVAGLAPDIGGQVAAGVQPLGNQNPIPVKDLPVAKIPGLPGGPPAPGRPPAPGQPPVYMPLARPLTPATRTANTVLFGGSIAWICVNAYWGNPIAIIGCSVMVATWFANVLGVNFRH